MLYIFSVHYSCFTSSYGWTLTQQEKRHSCLSTPRTMLIWKIITMKTQKNMKSKLKHCKQQSSNHIFLKMALVVLMFKHKVIPLHWAVWHRMTVSSQFLIQTLLSAESKIKAVFAWRNEQTKENQPKATFRTGSRPTDVRDEKQQFTANHRRKQGTLCTSRHWGACDDAVTETTLKRGGILLSEAGPGRPLYHGAHNCPCVCWVRMRCPPGHMKSCWRGTREQK